MLIALVPYSSKESTAENEISYAMSVSNYIFRL